MFVIVYDADPYFYKSSAIEMIIGSDYLPGVKINIGNYFEARETHFGWYLLGPEPDTEIQSFHTLVSACGD